MGTLSRVCLSKLQETDLHNLWVGKGLWTAICRPVSTLKSTGWATLSNTFIYWKDTSLTVAVLQSMSSNLLVSHIPQSISTTTATLLS